MAEFENALAREGITDEVEMDNTPSYVEFDSVIPVSKELGKLWSSRIDQAIAVRKNRGTEDAWSEAIRYYENDQSQHRSSENDASGSRPSKRIGRGWTETENIVFSNCSTMLPMLYAKNPSIEVTASDDEVYGTWASAAEELINKLFSLDSNPGVDLKPVVRRGTLWTLLTNAAYAKINWIKKADSSEKALEDLKEISEEYKNAKTKKDIEIAEGKLKALEAKVSLLTPSGPAVSLVSPFRMLIDPLSTKGNHSDATWMGEEDYIPTHYLNAVYGKSKDGKIVSRYEPTHILSASSSSNSVTELEDQVNNFSLFNGQTEAEQQARNFGFKSNLAFERAQHTKVYWIWDKTTRRLFLFAANKWDWPLWVWDDPLKLLNFFPYEHLWFHESVEMAQPKGEVTYYLDQQDRINDNNAALAQAREWAKHNIVYDKDRTNQNDVEKILKGPNGTAVGISLGEGGKIDDVLKSVVPPVMQHPELLDNAKAYEAINKITGISAAQQGAQFKTNTTNDAVDFYQKNVDIRVDEKIDCLEDWIGKIGWNLLQLCAQNMSVDDVAAIIGSKSAEGWKQVQDINQLRTHLNLRVVGGSTDKPTSKNKKRSAIEISQVLGQFAGGAPAVLIMALKVLSRAFSDDVVITNEDWAAIFKSINDQANAAGGGPSGATGGSETETAPDAGDPNADQSSVVKEQIASLIKKLPPEMQGKLQGMLDHGVPPEQALKDIVAQSQQQAA